jgi:acylphosphatase
MNAVLITITGRVQGVGFRYHTQKKAEQFNIKGFVKNQPDGTVYIEAEGEEIDLERFLMWCYDGPTWARVDDVKIQDSPVQNFMGFEVM